MIKVSVIIPSYRPGSYLFECLDSLKRQTLDKECFEVILIHNGEKEPYDSIINNYISDSIGDLNIKYFYTDIPSVSNARNIGISNSCGEYITFIDDDDYVSSEYLRELIDIADKDTVSLCYPLAFNDGDEYFFSYSITRQYDKISSSGKQVFYKARKFFSGPVYKLIHRDIIGDRRFDLNFKNGEDSLFMFLISDRIKYITFTSKKAVYYRRYRDNSAVSSKKTLSYKLKNKINLFKEYSLIFFDCNTRYSFIFYITRIIALFHW